jgi:hypothetical protein
MNDFDVGVERLDGLQLGTVNSRKIRWSLEG